MKALVYTGSSTLTIKDIPQPTAQAGEVVVKIARAAICGTDVHKFKDSAENLGTVNGEVPIAGHEPSGWVYELGAGVKGFAPGQRVLIAGVFSCGHCIHCRSGYNTACENGVSGLHWNNHGCDAEFISVPAANVLALPDSVSFDTATVLTCAGGTAMTIAKETGLRGGQKLAIVGLGPVGLSLLIIAKALGVQVVGIDVSQTRIQTAKKLGIDHAIDASKEDPVASVRKWSNSKGCEVVAECVGKGVTQLQAIEMAANRGKIAMAGLGDDSVPSDVLQRIIGNGGLTLVGIAATPIKHMHSLIAMTAELQLPFNSMITHRFSLEQASEALALMESGQCGKILFDLTDSPPHN